MRKMSSFVAAFVALTVDATKMRIVAAAVENVAFAAATLKCAASQQPTLFAAVAVALHAKERESVTFSVSCAT
jgi:uncharacterized protein YbaA (DUF1428 family)